MVCCGMENINLIIVQKFDVDLYGFEYMFFLFEDFIGFNCY